MNTKTAGQAAYERRRQLYAERWDDWYQLPEGARENWERIAQAARDWQPPAEKSLGEVASDAFAVARLNAGEAWDDAWQVAGEACARIGAERERAWWRAWIDENCGDCDDAEQMLAVLADRGKEQQP